MNFICTTIIFIHLAAMGLLVIIGEKALSFISTKSKRVRDWFDNLPMNKEE